VAHVLAHAAAGRLRQPALRFSSIPPKCHDGSETHMRNVTSRFSDSVAVEIKSLNGMVVPLGKNEFPNFDDKDSFELRVNTAEIAMDSRDLAIVLNSYVFRRPDSPLT
jgi:hypothetical protein